MIIPLKEEKKKILLTQRPVVNHYMYFFFFSDFIYLFIFPFIFISCRLITLQYCSGFCPLQYTNTYIWNLERIQ